MGYWQQRASRIRASGTLSVSINQPRTKMHWTQWQDQLQCTGGYQHTHCPYGHGHLASRVGLDVSHLAFGSILRDYTITPATSPAMGNILNHFLQYEDY